MALVSLRCVAFGNTYATEGCALTPIHMDHCFCERRALVFEGGGRRADEGESAVTIFISGFADPVIKTLQAFFGNTFVYDTTLTSGFEE